MALEGYVDATAEEIQAYFDLTSKLSSCPYHSKRDLGCLFLNKNRSVYDNCMACIRVRGLTEKQLRLAKTYFG